MLATPQSFIENPFCGRCLMERLSKTQNKSGEWVADGNHLVFVATEGNQPIPDREQTLITHDK